MTTEDTSNQDSQSGQENVTGDGTAATAMEALQAEQLQAFIAQMANQNQALSAQLVQTQNALTSVGQQQRQQQLATFTPEQRADALQQELDAIRQTAGAAYQQQVSTDVWRRRDAEAAARILRLSNLPVDHPKLYRGDWNQDWMPRFVASVEAISAETKTNGTGAAANPRENSSNRANVGSAVNQNIPELDPNADGPSTIRFALQKLAGERK